MALLAVPWILICGYAAWKWWRVRQRARMVWLDFQIDPDVSQANVDLARFRATAATFWFAAGVLGAVFGLLVIVDKGIVLQTVLIFGGPIILALMGHWQDRQERALVLRHAAEELE